jgi:hypothetical protein
MGKRPPCKGGDDRLDGSNIKASDLPLNDKWYFEHKKREHPFQNALFK